MGRDVRIVDSITQPDDAIGATVITGSHGGISAGLYAADLGVSGAIFHDAGVGKNRSGVEALDYLDGLGCPAGTADYRSARIGDGIDVARHGIISHLNETASDIGCNIGQDVLECAATIADANCTSSGEQRRERDRLTETIVSEGAVPVWALDSIGQITDRHENAIVIGGSHGERLAGETESYIDVDIAAITLFDAGVGKDRAGIGRLASMDVREIPAATVDVATARIGDGRSAWNEGTLSHVNDQAADAGVEPGDTTRQFADRIRTQLMDRNEE